VCGRRDSYWARRVEQGRSWVEGVARWLERVVVRRGRERGVEAAQVRGLKLG
jgi:aspartyl/asparaginyl beta-hydroxylase (cupin superfamily)